jgi:hypothetical protein
MLRKCVASEVRFGEQTQPGDSAGARKLMPLRFGNWTQLHFANDSFEESVYGGQIAERTRRAAKSFDDPFDSAHGWLRH